MTTAFDPEAYETERDTLIGAFQGDPEDHPFSALGGIAMREGYSLSDAFQRATSDLAERRRRFLGDFGVGDRGKIDPTVQFGTYQNTLRQGGASLDNILSAGRGRGLGEGSGLARRGESAGLARVKDMRDTLDTRLIDQEADFTTMQRDFRADFGTGLFRIREEGEERKMTEEGFGPGPGLPDRPSKKPRKEQPGTVAEQTKNTAAAGKFATKRLRMAKRLKIGGNFAIPKDPIAAAAKWRKVSGRLNAKQLARIRKGK